MNLDLESWKDPKDVWLDTKELDSFIARVEEVTISSPAERDDRLGVLAELRDLKAELEKRLNRLAHKGQYLEVPVKLRRNYTRKLKRLNQRLVEQIEPLNSSMDELPGGECTPEDDLSAFHSEQAQLWMRQAQDEMDFLSRARDAAKRADKAHGWYGLGGGFRRADYREEWGFNPSMASHYKKEYSKVKRNLKEGDKTWNDAAEAVDDVIRYGNFVLDDPLNESLFMLLSETFTESMEQLRKTANAFESAYDILHKIYSNHEDHVAFRWEPYPKRAVRQ